MLRVSTSIDSLTYGDNRVSRVLAGGIGPGSLAFLVGDPGSGKSVLCQHIAHNVLADTQGSVAYFTNYRKTDNLLDQMESLGFHVHYHFISDRLRVYLLQLIGKCLTVDEAMHVLLHCLNDLPPSYGLVIIDDLSRLLLGATPMTQLGFVHRLKLHCEERRRAVLVAIEPYVFTGGTLSRIFAMSDYYLKTDVPPVTLGLEQIDSRVMRSLEIKKMRGAETATGSIQFEIRAGSGIHILPYVNVRV